MLRDHGQKDSRRSGRLRPALFPVPKRRGLKAELRGECGLAQSEAEACRLYIDDRYLNRGDADGSTGTFRPRYRFAKIGEDSASGRGLLGFHLFLLHVSFLCRYPATKRGSNAFISFCSALVKFVFSFFGKTLIRNRGNDSL